MTKHGGRVVVVLIAGLMVWALSGCGGGISPTGSHDMGAAAVQSVFLTPYTDGVNQTPRWMDIADYLYASSFVGSFAHPANRVQLSFYDSGGLQFALSAPARALKPNFCYQMKIEGPAKPWTGDLTGADFVNWNLGHNGRWWNDTDNIPLSDGDLAAHVGDSIKGYLYFDFAFTNKDGSVSRTAPVKNSYHVTWKSTQRSRTANDGALRSCSVVVARDGWAYDRKQTTKTVKLYGEWEPGRPTPGTLTLPAGTYGGLEFRLTEESFHSTASKGGNWRTVMNAPLPAITVQ